MGLFAAALVAAVAWPRAANAACVDVGCVVGWIYVLAVPVVIAGVAVVGIDVYETAIDIGDASAHRAPTSPRAGFELGFGAIQTGVLGTVAVAVGAGGDAPTSFGLLAFASWPLAIGMHGAWGGRTDPYGGFPSEILPVAALDLGILAYDAARIARRDDPSRGYALAETFGALPQLGFAVAAAAGGRGADVPSTLAMSALPVAMIAHGVYELAAKERGEHAPSQSWHLVPTFGRDARGSTAGLGVVGVF